MDQDIIVIGSINMDLVVKTDRAPEAGETLHGLDFKMIPGGKGANQAVAVSKLGGKVVMVGCLGDDSFGEDLLYHLTQERIDTRFVRRLATVPTGTATIVVESTGENRIIVVPGANGNVSPADIDQAAERIRSARAVVLQFEVPLETVEYAIGLSDRFNVPVILNPAPAYPISDRVLKKVHYLILNESETKSLSSMNVIDVESGARAAHYLSSKGPRGVIITLGHQGAVAVMGEKVFHIPAYPVSVVDTTAAGDAFVGAFALATSRGDDPREAVRYAVAAGSLTVTRFGAQPSLPNAEEVNQLLALR